MKTELLPNGNLLVRALLNLRRVSNRRLVLPDEAADNHPARALLVRIARARRWMLDLESGRHESPAALAASLGMDRSNFMRELALADLAPDVVRALLAGDLPPDLSLALLQKVADRPWAAQKKALGLPRNTPPQGRQPRRWRPFSFPCADSRIDVRGANVTQRAAFHASREVTRLRTSLPCYHKPVSRTFSEKIDGPAR